MSQKNRYTLAFQYYQDLLNTEEETVLPKCEIQYNLWTAYLHGIGTRQDKAKALEMLILSAAQGFALAEYDLSLDFENCEKDFVQAKLYMERAAEHGDEEAQRHIGDWYYFGKVDFGIDIDRNVAINWYKLSADQGLMTSQYFLATRASDEISDSQKLDYLKRINHILLDTPPSIKS